MLKKGFLFAAVYMLLSAPAHATGSKFSFETRGALFFYMGESKFNTIGEPIPFAKDQDGDPIPVASPGTCGSSTIGFIGGE